MQQPTVKKTITLSIKKSDIDGKFDLNGSIMDQHQKLNLAKSVLDITSNFNDEIDLDIQDDEIVFKWHPAKFDNRAESFHKNALLLARKGNLDDAIQEWTRATLLNTLDPDYFFNLGVAYFEKKQFQEAIENLNRVLAICPFYVKAHLILGTAFLKIRKFEFAKKHLQKSIKYNNNNSLSFLNLGAVHSILKENDDGICMFKQAITLSPNEPRAYLGLAKIYSTIGNSEKANDYFKKVIELDKKGNLANYAKRSIVSTTTVDTDEVDFQQDAAKGNPEDYYSEGYHYFVSGDYEKSATMYKKYLSIKPKDDYVWCALGEVQIRSGKIDAALESLKKAIMLYPKKGLYYKEIAIVFDKLNKPDKVVKATSKAKELGKTDSLTYCLWGKALYQLGNFDEAILMLEHALKANRNNFLAKYYLIQTLIKSQAIDDAIDHLYELKETKINTPIKQKALSLYGKLTQE